MWVQRELPNANLLLLLGAEATPVDSGFVSHAAATAALAHEHAQRVSQVANTHWHSGHVGGDALFQKAGAAVIGSPFDADALDRADPGCCVAEYLDQPVPQYTIDRAVSDGDRPLLGDAEWEVLEIPAHTPGHLAFWNPDDRLLTVGDALSSYDVGRVNVMLDGPSALDAYIAAQAWARDAAALLGPTIEEFARHLVDPMLDAGALVLRNGSAPVGPAVFELPSPEHWEHRTKDGE